MGFAPVKKNIAKTYIFKMPPKFESVSHKRLVKKLKGYGVHDNVLNWIEDFFV